MLQTEMKLIECVKSKVDATKKYIFNLRGQEVEFSYIQKNDGKDIIVCPCQTSCNMGCTFCFLTGLDLPVINLTADDIYSGVMAVIREAKLPESPELLLSFMGSGEPLLNYRHIIGGCRKVCQDAQKVGYKSLRFAISTMIPSSASMREFTKAAKHLPFKMHLSLHSPFDEVRRKMMPCAVSVIPSMELMREYKTTTKNPIEIHYTLIDGINDRDEDQQELLNILDKDTPIKILDFKIRSDSEMKKSSRTAQFISALEEVGIPTEVYDPPGSDVGSSCGQFIRNKLVTL